MFDTAQVCTFGSVPLKTYLPDGDIDLTAFSNDQNLKDTWANQVRDMLENEEKNENAEFHVKEVQYIQAEVCFLPYFIFLGRHHLFQNKKLYQFALCSQLTLNFFVD